jgi:hypothetical protein
VYFFLDDHTKIVSTGGEVWTLRRFWRTRGTRVGRCGTGRVVTTTRHAARNGVGLRAADAVVVRGDLVAIAAVLTRAHRVVVATLAIAGTSRPSPCLKPLTFSTTTQPLGGRRSWRSASAAPRLPPLLELDLGRRARLHHRNTAGHSISLDRERPAIHTAL